MFLSSYISRIEELLESGDADKLTYAALEARLALERICYEILKINIQHVDGNTREKWQPKPLINSLQETVDPYITSPKIISISKTPCEEDRNLTKEEFEQYDYVEIGRTAGIDLKKFNSIYQSLGSYLHTRMPRPETIEISRYPVNDKTKEKIIEALYLIKHHNEATNVQIGAFGETTSFKCLCGTVNTRIINGIKKSPALKCVNTECLHKWKVTVSDEGDIEWKTPLVELVCKNNNCKSVNQATHGQIFAIHKGKFHSWSCGSCGTEHLVGWGLSVQQWQSPKK
ncbi:hypothetical protein AB6B38_09525 [Glycocaulis abyssi]|uniref:Uncharacterized protein n=1 Tax=Glycocaulis abyssi TaxID=1433403 RepID=A0ABV9NAJ1_9PROT